MFYYRKNPEFTFKRVFFFSFSKNTIKIKNASSVFPPSKIYWVAQLFSKQK